MSPSPSDSKNVNGEANGAVNGDSEHADAPQQPGKTPTDPMPAVAEAPETPEARIAALETQNRELQDRMLRLAADFENWKKRARREQEEASSRGREALLKEILPALDNLERALKAAPEKDPVAVGVRLVDKQLLGALDKFEVKRFSALGQPFDPNLHEAIQQVESADVAPGSVATEFAVGYMIGTRLLRAAMVGVAKAPEPAKEGGEG
jgi:molecular chaperone GrpE